ncbi:MAG: flagellar M-ring protein FliF [Hyphomicrobiales bacterium]|nr:flagellar M-ring protein FliF [Hyphomicrobiales bacterium]MBV8440079.1 flagellar M-ring protein FliF [Hyphomicrobiales bacterium]
MAQAERLWTNLQGLGVRRLVALALIGVAVFAVTGLAGYYLSRPTMETLYSGLDRDDIAAIGSALREAGVPFDVNAESTIILTPTGQAATARMILAEKGLPRSGAVGNELFDKLGSLGLTSFMQDVTRLRALEGELARTIQMMRPVKAARVHIVLPDEGSFRRERQPSSASVVIRTDGGDDRATGQAIRHLVASAVPGMKIDDVTVLNVDGRLLASGSDSIEKSPDNLLSLENEVSQEIREGVGRTLTPYLSSRNFQISVAVRLNADKTQTNETIYNPDSRVERSVRVTKEQQSSQNAAGTQATGVEANLPKQNSSGSESKQSNDQTQKREELTNYEVSSKSIQTTSAGFLIQNLSVAVLINRAALTASLGDKAGAEALAAQIKEIEQLVASAAGLDKQRGDVVKVSVVDFVDSSRDLEPAPGPSILEILARQTGSIANAGAVVLVAAMVVWFGMRPGLKMLLASPAAAGGAANGGSTDATPALGAPDAGQNFLIESDDGRDAFLEALLARRDNGPLRKLQKLVEFDENHAATILKQWIRQEANG